VCHDDSAPRLAARARKVFATPRVHIKRVITAVASRCHRIASLAERAVIVEVPMRVDAVRPRQEPRRVTWVVVLSATLVGLVAFPVLALAQSPWERAASNLEVTFTGPLARSLALVAIVIGGLMFMFGEGGAKRQISGIIFGGGLALFAAQFLAWLF
jgi:type IV secretory pathway VirB2 component (pilin)